MTTKKETKAQRTKRQVSSLIERNYRQASGTWAGGQNHICVRLAGEKNSTGHLSVEARTKKVWNGKWSGLDAHFEISGLPKRWEDTVLRRGVAILGGMVNLTAKLCHGPALDRARQDHQAYVYRASWMRQARGLGIGLETGWVAVDGYDGPDVDDSYLERGGHKTCYHSTASAEAALRGLLRKMASERKEEARARERRTLVAIFQGARCPGKIGGLVVTRQDAIDAGNCRPGSTNFCNRHLNGEDRATVSELAAKVSTLPKNVCAWFLSGLISTVLRVIHRQRIEGWTEDRYTVLATAANGEK